MYIYLPSQLGQFTVGFHDPRGNWHPESQHNTTRSAAQRCAFLNAAAPRKIARLLYDALQELTSDDTEQTSFNAHYRARTLLKQINPRDIAPTTGK